MNKRLPIIIFVLLALVCLAGMARSTARLSSAKQEVDAVERTVRDTMTMAAEVFELRSRQQRVEQQQRPQQDVIARVNAVFTRIGLPQKHFRGLTPESDVIIPSSAPSANAGPSIRRQTVRVTLNNIELTELGQFLDTWRRDNPVWTTTRIDLNHTTGRSAAGNRYDVTLLLSALYLGERESPV